MGYIDLKLH